MWRHHCLCDFLLRKFQFSGRWINTYALQLVKVNRQLWNLSCRPIWPGRCILPSKQVLWQVRSIINLAHGFTQRLYLSFILFYGSPILMNSITWHSLHHGESICEFPDGYFQQPCRDLRPAGWTTTRRDVGIGAIRCMSYRKEERKSQRYGFYVNLVIRGKNYRYSWYSKSLTFHGSWSRSLAEDTLHGLGAFFGK